MSTVGIETKYNLFDITSSNFRAFLNYGFYLRYRVPQQVLKI